MDRIKVLVDSGSDISLEDSEQLSIGVVPCNYIIHGQTSHDFYNLDRHAFCDQLRSANTAQDIPTTSQPSPADYLNYYHMYANEGYEHLIVITMSPLGSGSYNCAHRAAEVFLEEQTACKVSVIDSGSCSLNMVMEAKKAVSMIQQGHPAEQIVETLQQISKKVATYYLVDNITFLMKGGRVSTIKGGIANTLRLKPIITIRETGGSNIASALGYQNGLAKMVSIYSSEADLSAPLYISHADNLQNATQLADRIRKIHPDAEIYIHPMGSTMAVHAGPDAVGMFFLRK